MKRENAAYRLRASQLPGEDRRFENVRGFLAPHALQRPLTCSHNAVASRAPGVCRRIAVVRWTMSR